MSQPVKDEIARQMPDRKVVMLAPEMGTHSMVFAVDGFKEPFKVPARLGVPFAIAAELARQIRERK